MATMTALLASNILGAGRKDVHATFRGPNAAEGGYVLGGTALNLASKPAAATPALFEKLDMALEALCDPTANTAPAKRGSTA